MKRIIAHGDANCFYALSPHPSPCVYLLKPSFAKLIFIMKTLHWFIIVVFDESYIVASYNFVGE